MQEDYQVILVDGSSYLFRAFHALPALVSSKGQPTGAVRGVISMIRKLINDYPDTHVAVVFDAKGKTFRNDIYPEYKANRAAMPDELRSQIEPIHQIIKAMGLPLMAIEGVEADDVIGTLAREASEQEMRVLISTGDKDMAQLVDDHVRLINTMTDTFMDAPAVVEKFGVRPDQIIDYLALVGDTSDNIPGVHKCGPKTAVKWLDAYENLDGVMANADSVKGKVGEYLREAIDHLPMSYELATIRKDVSLPCSVNELSAGEPDVEALQALFTELEFKPWVEELNAGTVAEVTSAAVADTDYETVFTEEALATWIQKLKDAPSFAFDTETTSIDYMEAQLVGVSFAVEPGIAAYVPVAHDYEGAPTQLALATVLDALRELLEDPQRIIIGQNLKYDMTVLANHGVEVRAQIYDSMLESYVLNSVGSRHNMDDLALKYLSRQTVHFEDIAGKGSKQLTFNQIEIETAAHYAAEDADITLQLHQTLLPQVDAEDGLRRVLHDIELPLVPVLSQIERQGVLIDAALLEKQSEEIESQLAALEKTAYELAGEEFNLGSTKQLQEIFFNKLQLPVIKKTPKGQPSTAEPVLQELALDYPLPKVIMDYRGLSKLKSTYTDQLPKQIDTRTGRVHTSYHQAVAATGRLSSTDPNLQNIPIRTEEGRRVRKAFVAPPGYVLLAADYSQIELRIMAHLSGDEVLTNAFREGLDVHRVTAAEVFGRELDDVRDNERRSAKAINFGLIYGMSAFGLARQLNIARGDAQDYINRYFERYPGVRAYMDDTRALAAEQGYVETLFGRRLYLPEIKASNFQRRQAAERTAINAPMQGTAADIIKRAMLGVSDWLADEQPDARMVMQVHDELVFEVGVSAVEAVSDRVDKLMSGAAELTIPLEVEVGVGEDWDAAH